MDRPAADPALSPALTPALSPAVLTDATARLIGAQATQEGRFGIAVSGGPDSLALLLLAHGAFPGRIAAATVDHGLRADSAAEAAMVARLCADRGIAHSILTPPQPITGSLQAAARTARYAALHGWRGAAGLDWLMTAHHADDQLETLVMRLNRSSGVTGLSGIRAVQGKVLRPLLAVRRAALTAVVDAAGLCPVDDPANRDPRFDRARIRAALAASPIDPVAASASMALLAEAEAALDWSAHRLAAERITATDHGLAIAADTLPADLVRRLLRLAQMRLDPASMAPRGDAVTRAIAALDAGQPAMLGAMLVRPAADGARRWLATAAPPRRTP